MRHSPMRFAPTPRSLKRLLFWLLWLPLAAAADVTLSDGYARATPPGIPHSAAFMTLENTSARTIKLIGAATPVARSTELHSHSMSNGVMRMRQVTAIALPANGRVTLQPGGDHLMLMGLTQSLKAGDTLDLELEFDDGSRQRISLPVRRPSATPPKRPPGQHAGH